MGADQGSYRNRAYAKGHAWGLGPNVVRTFDRLIKQGITPERAMVFAITAWDVDKPPGIMCDDHVQFLINCGALHPRKDIYE